MQNDMTIYQNKTAICRTFGIGRQTMYRYEAGIREQIAQGRYNEYAINDRSEDSRPHCAICGGVIWEDKAISFNDRWFCWECETEAWKDIRKDFLERTSNE